MLVCSAKILKNDNFYQLQCYIITIPNIIQGAIAQVRLFFNQCKPVPCTLPTITKRVHNTIYKSIIHDSWSSNILFSILMGELSYS